MPPSKSRYSSDWIHHLEAEVHWRYYWHQQKLMEGRLDKGDRVLEIGVGSGFTANYLRSKGFGVTTLDIDAGKSPDVIADICEKAVQLPACDAALAFNVFEHMPYACFQGALEGLAKAGARKLFLALPWNRKVVVDIHVKFPGFWGQSLFLTRPLGRIVEPHHHWELGLAPHTLETVLADVGRSGFALEARLNFRLQSYLYFRKP